jgi:hypothetical protein
MKKGLVLNRVVLLGRTFEEYCHCFDLDAQQLRDGRILDVAAGVSSFCAEANARGLNAVAVDLIYSWPWQQILARCEPDLDEVVTAMAGLEVYRWGFYKSPAGMRQFRSNAYQKFISDFRKVGRKRYVAARLPTLPFRPGQFDRTLVSYLLFVYEDQLDYAFHKSSILELARVTSGEVRIYPIVTFEGVESKYLKQLVNDPDLQELEFDVRKTDFEFLRDSNYVLIIRKKIPGTTNAPGI